MDRIRKALDLARLERVHHEAASTAAVTEFDAVPAANGSPASIVYSRTRVFTPTAGVLEDNRIINPASTDPAAVAFRMLRTQVLQRMDAHGWRSIAIFSPGASDGKTTTDRKSVV